MTDYTGTENLEMMAEAVNYNRFLLSLVRENVERDSYILDIGAGIGTFAAQLQSEGYTVSCVEPDERQAIVVGAKGITVFPSVAEVKDESIDFVYALNVLEHIENDVGALVEWRRKLRPGGRILVYVPAFQSLYSSMDAKVGHFRRYSRAELVSKIARAGFQIGDSRYADSAGFFAAALYKMLRNDSGRINRTALIAFDRWVFPISRILDLGFCKFLGKNLIVVATNPT